MNTQHNASHEFSRVGMVFAGLTLLVTVLQIFLGFLLRNFCPVLVSDDNYNLMISTAMLYTPAIPILYFGLRVPTTEKPILQKKTMSWKLFLRFFCMTYFMLIVSNLIGLSLTEIIGSLKGSPVDNPVFSMFEDTNLILMFVLTVVLAPLFEEVFFRKMLIDRIVKYGERTALIVSGLVFGLFHGNLNQFAYAFVIGMFFGYIYIRTGRILYSILLHAMVNFMGSIASIIVLKGVDLNALPTNFAQTDEILAFVQTYGVGIIILMIYEILILSLVILGIIFFIQYFRKFYVVSRETDIPGGEVLRTVMYNKGMIAYTVIWIIFIVMQILE